MMSNSKAVTTAVIPAAGLGTRFLPLTKSQPKEMLPLVDKPAIQYVVEEAVGAGITDILVITGRGKRAIEDHFDRNFELDFALREKGKVKELEALEEIESLANIHYIRQRDARGLGHAISVSRAHVGNQPFAVMLGDDIMHDGSELLINMVNDHLRTSSSVVGLMKVDPKDISSYGCVSVSDDSPKDSTFLHIEEIVEKPDPQDAPSDMAVIGRYVFTPEIFDCIDLVQPGVGNEIQLTDAIAYLLKEHDVYGRVSTYGRYDVGQKADWIIANVSIALERDDIGDEVRNRLRAMLDDETK
jgi:UTP--glucose-1-phosphate uridylyltransferase